MARRGVQTLGGAARFKLGPSQDVTRSIPLQKYVKPPKLKPLSRAPIDSADGCGSGYDEEPEVIAVPPPTPPSIVGFAKATTPLTQGVDDTGNLTIPVPAGVQDGDLLIAVTRASSTSPDPVGWTLIAGTPAFPLKMVWSRIAASEPASYTWTHSTAFSRTGCMGAFRGGVLGNVLGASLAAGAPLTCPNVAAGSAAGALWVGFAICTDSQNDEDYTVTGAHTLQVQHVGKTTAANPVAAAMSTQADLAADQVVTGNTFIDTNASSGGRYAAALIINPVT